MRVFLCAIVLSITHTVSLLADASAVVSALDDVNNVLVDAHNGQDLVKPSSLFTGLGPVLASDVLSSLQTGL